ncbi:MAG TPA: phage integrase SAM-like domain-containing protein [Oscillospiraceae bacterium]|nr:phage integrase SAM-like domain-containing protein [Oscillospiraceae bacterium]
MGNVNFQYRSKKDSANIEIRFTFKDSNDKFRSYYTRTNIEVSKEFWNEYKSNTRFRDVEKANLKNEIDNHLNEIEKFILEQYQQETAPIQKDWLKDIVSEFYKPKNNNTISDNLIQFFDFYLSHKKHEITKGTLRKWNVVRNKLENFEKNQQRKFKIKDVNKTFLDAFINWSKEMQYSNSVINSNFKDIRAVCNEAQLYNIEISNDLHLLKTNLRNETAFKIYLTEQELQQISDLKDLPDYLDNARDWLIISCYTGQRVSDFKRFTPDMTRKQGNGLFIDIKQLKTGKDVTIPLLPQVEKILNKRNGEYPRTISDQRYNEYIKEVCKLANINEMTKGRITKVTDVGTRKVKGKYEKWRLITSHVGRRSFATNYYGKLPTSFIKDITGHGTEAMLLKYIGKTSKDTAVEAYDLMLNL